jgi:uncharacterized protein (DUF433 family)
VRPRAPPCRVGQVRRWDLRDDDCCVRYGVEGGLLKIDLREPRRALAASLRDLRGVRRLVVSDPDVLGGDPVFRGTRVPVHLIAELVAQGGKPAELIEGYPRLTAVMIRLAPAYAAAYPLRKLPWRDQPPVRRRRRRLDTIAVMKSASCETQRNIARSNNVDQSTISR